MDITLRTKEILFFLPHAADKATLIVEHVQHLFNEIKAGGPDALRAFGEALMPAAEPQLTYAWVELFGHNSLGICAVREVRQFGVTFCEASPLDAEGKPGRPQQVAGQSIYRIQPVSKETALSVAKRRLGYLPAHVETNSIDEFLRECCETGEGKRISVQDLHFAYGEWCDRRGFEKMSPRSIAMRVTEIAAVDTGPPEDGSKSYTGIGLSEEAREEFLAPIDAEWEDGDDDRPLEKRIEAARAHVANLEDQRERARGQDGYDHIDEMLDGAKERLRDLLDEQAATSKEQISTALNPPPQ